MFLDSEEDAPISSISYFDFGAHCRPHESLPSGRLAFRGPSTLSLRTRLICFFNGINFKAFEVPID